jgi:hypothetical protein
MEKKVQVRKAHDGEVAPDDMMHHRIRLHSKTA